VGLYTIDKPCGPNGIKYFSLVKVGNRWTLTPWKRPEDWFATEVEIEIEALSENFTAIPNDSFHAEQRT
jgi:hypothetical protein